MTKNSPARPPRPVVLCILDGWGAREETRDNAIAAAPTPHLDALFAACPHTTLEASAGDVGLPDGQMGNSEVGHTNLGAGRVVLQDLPRINQAVSDGSLAGNPRLLDFIGRLKAGGGSCHVMGLLSPGGVHSHQDHMAALAGIVAAAGVPVRVHAFLDGRDTPPRSALAYMRAFQAAAPAAPVATVSGRYWAMDRDKRWQRVERAYRALADGQGETAASAIQAIEQSYDVDAGDEFVAPTIIGGYAGMADGDGLLMANFRPDRAREILTALVDPAFDGFRRARPVAFAAALGMTSYSAALEPFMAVLFGKDELTGILGQVVADAGLTQLRIAETEKYAHVTFFLNGGREAKFAGEERILVPSPKAATYDLKPEMSAPQVTDDLVAAIGSDRFDLIVVNYANGDMVGHTGVWEAALKAVEAVDGCIGRLVAAVAGAGGAMLICADHGNCDLMVDPETGAPFTAHTLSPVPLLLVGGGPRVTGLRPGRLADVAPTVLALMGLARPAEMTGRSLLIGARGGARAAQ